MNLLLLFNTFSRLEHYNQLSQGVRIKVKRGIVLDDLWDMRVCWVLW